MVNEKGGNEKDKALDEAIAQIHKQFGKGSLMNLGEHALDPIDVIPTGCVGLDMALGVGGYPRGRIIEVFGMEAAGKSTLCFTAIRECQKLGGKAVLIDAENAFDATYAKVLGIDIDKMMISQPDCGEQGLEIVDALVRSNGVDLIVVDSVAALVPRAELEGSMGDSHMGLHARLMSQAMRKLSYSISQSKTCVMFINQIRMKIGVMFGSPETTTGGQALKFYSSVRLDVRKVGVLKDGEDAIGTHVRVKVVKNKVAPPFKECEFDILFKEGISYYGSLFDLAVSCGIVEQSGAWFSYKNEKLSQGRDKGIQRLRDDKKLADELYSLVKQMCMRT